MTNNMFQTYFIIRRINTCLSIRLLIDHEYIYGIQEKNYEAGLDRVSVFIKRQETIKYHVFSGYYGNRRNDFLLRGLHCMRSTSRIIAPTRESWGTPDDYR